MLLAIDIGNTHIFYGVHDGAEWRLTWRQHTNPLVTEDEIAVFAQPMLERIGAKVGRVGISSVVPALDDAFHQYCVKWLEREPAMVTHKATGRLKLAVRHPETVGADRIANGVAALTNYFVPAIVVDLGTATTFDAISAGNEYLGGAIMPGVEISMAALFQRAAKLPKISLSAPPKVIGADTETSLASGIVLGTAAAIDGMVGLISQELGAAPFVIATGGLAPSIASNCKTVQQVDPMLTLEGIRILTSA
jgi:type III pantothenate kinase